MKRKGKSKQGQITLRQAIAEAISEGEKNGFEYATDLVGMSFFRPLRKLKEETESSSPNNPQK
jgi:hypothetical protein